MKKNIIIGVGVVICIVAVAVAYLAGSGGKLSDLPLPDLTPSSKEDLYGSWILSDLVAQDPVSGEWKSDPKTATNAGKYIAFQNDGRACSNGYLDEQGLPKPCDSWGTYQVNGDIMTLQGSGAPDFPIRWNIKGGQLELIIDASLMPSAPQDSSQPTKLKLILTKIKL